MKYKAKRSKKRLLK